MSLATIPAEVGLNMISYLPPKEAWNLGKTCKQYYTLIQNESYWKTSYQYYYPIAFQILAHSPSPGASWQQTFKLAHSLSKRIQLPAISSVQDFKLEQIFLSNQQELILYKEGGDTFVSTSQLSRRPNSRGFFVHVAQASLKALIPSANLSREVKLEAFPRRFNANEIHHILVRPSFIALGMASGKIFVYDSKGKFKRQWIEHTGPITALRAQGELIYSGSGDHSIRIWSLLSDKSLYQLKEHTKAVSCLDFIDSQRFISGSFDNTLILWQRKEEGFSHQTIKTHHAGIIALQALSLFAASADQAGVVHIHNLQNQICFQTIKIEDFQRAINPISDLSWDKDKLTILLRTGVIQVWDYHQAVCLTTIPKPASFSPHYLFCESSKIQSFSFLKLSTIELKAVENKPENRKAKLIAVLNTVKNFFYPYT
ncbi:F-box-like domain-containing protein [Candidatus Protochlamydia phocaeensis]|uniref:F-box-like domain-containing protein n=1 Tax=Candidatus Protochlamydia phocaeensis TaxID=1414722 RepID=UPI0008380F46|nr:F-box-like domain-containing protein [Candidatus Protochlamydia phocaeensis]